MTGHHAKIQLNSTKRSQVIPLQKSQMTTTTTTTTTPPGLSYSPRRKVFRRGQKPRHAVDVSFFTMSHLHDCFIPPAPSLRGLLLSPHSITFLHDYFLLPTPTLRELFHLPYSMSHPVGRRISVMASMAVAMPTVIWRIPTYQVGTKNPR